jgi:glycosyltransferase involved in cell wall biosynthesis
MPSPIAFIIPALNEEAALAPMLDGLRAALDAVACADADIVVVDNGSRDATADVARKHGARVVSELRRGYGQACLAGIAALSRVTQIIVFLDANGSDDPEDLLRLLAPAHDDKADLLLGSRIAAAKSSRAFTPQQAFGNWLATRLMRLLFDAHYTDLGPFRVIRRDALDRLHERHELRLDHRNANQSPPRRIAHPGDSGELPETNRRRVQNFRKPRRNGARRLENHVSHREVRTLFRAISSCLLAFFAPSPPTGGGCGNLTVS